MDQYFATGLEGATCEEAEPLAALLELSLPTSSSGFLRRDDVDKLWRKLSYLGSNDVAFALRGFEGVGYAEIVRDVCKAKGLKDLDERDSLPGVEANERRLLRAIFEEAWERMTEEEKTVLLQSLGDQKGNVSVASSAAAAGVLLGEFGGFATYKVTMMIANWIARALLGRGLTIVGNAMLARVLGVVLGPVGWVASGGWLALDMAGPATRKTVPAVVQLAALRQLTRQREVVGVMGHGSTGKDSLLKALFNIDTKRIDPIPGSTSAAETYTVAGESPLRVVNFPGFGDLRAEVENEIHQQARACTTIIYLFNGSEIPKADEIGEWSRYAKLEGRNGPVAVIPVLNKWDKADEDERPSILRETARRLGRDDIIVTSMKSGRPFYEEGLAKLRERLNELARTRDRAEPFPNGKRTTAEVIAMPTKSKT